MGTELSTELNEREDPELSEALAGAPRPACRYKLTSLDECGQAEPIRLLFRVVGVPLLDHRITAQQWLSIKTKCQYRSLPVLEINNAQYGEAAAILRWAARKFGLNGRTDKEELMVEAALHQFLTVWPVVSPCVSREWDTDQESERWEEVKGKLEEVLSDWERIATNSSSQNKVSSFLVGTSLTVADLVLFGLLDELTGRCHTGCDVQLNRYPKLLHIKSCVANLPQIRDYLTVRPSKNFQSHPNGYS